MLNIEDSLLTFGLTDGGTAGLIWGFVIISCGFTLVFASIAEMASMQVNSFFLDPRLLNLID